MGEGTFDSSKTNLIHHPLPTLYLNWDTTATLFISLGPMCGYQENNQTPKSKPTKPVVKAGEAIRTSKSYKNSFLEA
jgi:hypothetical protein